MTVAPQEVQSRPLGRPLTVSAASSITETDGGSTCHRLVEDRGVGLRGRLEHYPRSEKRDLTSDALVRRRKILAELSRCKKKALFTFGKKLSLERLSLTDKDVPLEELVGTVLGNQLHALSLAANRNLVAIPAQLVVRNSLPNLQRLNLSYCGLRRLPQTRWDLPKLQSLDLSSNCLSEFPGEHILAGLPRLLDLNLFGNCITEITFSVDPSHGSPRNSALRLRSLNVGYNDLIALPVTLPPSLRYLNASHNFLEHVPREILLTSTETGALAATRLRTLDVTCNPITEPPLDSCEGGAQAMRRYYRDKHKLYLKFAQKDPKRRLSGKSRGSSRTLASLLSLSGYPAGRPSSGRELGLPVSRSSRDGAGPRASPSEELNQSRQSTIPSCQESASREFGSPLRDQLGYESPVMLEQQEYPRMEAMLRRRSSQEVPFVISFRQKEEDEESREMSQ